MLVYICTKDHKNIFGDFKVTKRTQIPYQKAYCLIMVYICTNISEDILKDIRVMERTRMMGRLRMD